MITVTRRVGRGQAETWPRTLLACLGEKKTLLRRRALGVNHVRRRGALLSNGVAIRSDKRDIVWRAVSLKAVVILVFFLRRIYLPTKMPRLVRPLGYRLWVQICVCVRHPGLLVR